MTQPMPDQVVQLRRKLDTFSLDDETAAFRFSQRLARENGWPADYARRVMHEYKRFVLLAVAAGHPVTPSEQVDQVWHLHLTYTRSYWTEFCPQILGGPLHHGPTSGGAAAHDKYRSDYERTRASYRVVFGEAPPLDIWPEPEQRFGRDLAWQRVNVSENWVLPKPQFRRARRAFWALVRHWRELSRRVQPLLLWSLVGCGCALGCESPLDLTGGPSLLFFVFLFLLSQFVAHTTWLPS